MMFEFEVVIMNKYFKLRNLVVIFSNFFNHFEDTIIL